jgi:hypothetical protein
METIKSFIGFLFEVLDDIKVFCFQCLLFQSKDRIDWVFGMLMWLCLFILTYALICLFKYM